MSNVLLTITDDDADLQYWRRWNFATKTETTTNLTHANISPNGSSATALKLALNPRVEPLGIGSRLVLLGIPGKDASFIQSTGSDSLTLTYKGDLRNSRSGETGYDFSADPTQSAIADRDCLFWAYFNSVELSITLSDGTVIPNMVISNFLPNRSGQVVGGYSYDLELIEKIVP